LTGKCRTSISNNPRYLLAVLGVILAFTTAILLMYLSFGSSYRYSVLPYPTHENIGQGQPAEPPSSQPSEEKPEGLPIGLRHTSIPSGAHIHGFTVLDNIYLRNGTLYVVTPDQASLPPRDRLLSRPVERGPGVDIEPTDEASALLGFYILRLMYLFFSFSNCSS
jgi:hypothetical protein